MKQQLLERLLRYVSFDTQSDPTSETYPSTAKQLHLLAHLMEELLTLGATEVSIDPNGYVMGTIPATAGAENVPVIGFISHVDTSPDMSSKGVKPQIVENYNGLDIPLAQSGVIMRLSDFPELAHFKGHTLITTDGTTLLGADDKAGIAEIMTAADFLLAHPEIPHGKIRIGFTPDEEIGRGVDFFNIDHFGAKFAYTMDGGFEGEIEYENFNAAGARIEVQGRNIHPGYAKDKMINSLDILCEINAMLPFEQRPQHTCDYEGFYHLVTMDGSVEKASCEYIIRDHSRAKFEARKEFITSIVALLNQKYGANTLQLTIRDQYYNMREMVEPHIQVVDKAIQAMRLSGVEPLVRPIRGGTDGSRLSYMGLPCPNIFTGGMNFHGKFEFCSLDTMCRATETIINLAKLWAK